MENEKVIVKLDNVTKVFDNKTCGLEEVTTSIDAGEFIFIIGPSGAGKSTLLKLLFRQELPTSGEIWVDNQNVALAKRKALTQLRKNIGIVFQDVRLLEDRTAYENIAYSMEVLCYPKKEIEERVPGILKMVGMDHRSDHYPRQLSGGEQQRIGIGRAIINNPKIILADEPCGNIDVKNAIGVMDIFKEINEKGTTVIMSTHDRYIVDKYKERVLELNAGRLVRDEKGGSYGRILETD